MNGPARRLVSVVAIVVDDADGLPVFVAEVLDALARADCDHELILVDDASGPATVAAAEGVLAAHEGVRVIRLSRRHGTDVAATAGLDSAIGDLAVVLAVATDPPRRIPDFVVAVDQGFDVVVGTVDSRSRPMLAHVGSAAFRRLFRWMTRVEMATGVSTMHAFTRRALNAVTRIRRKKVHLPVLCSIVGFQSTTLSYEPIAVARRSSWIATLGESISILVANSPAPLRVVTYLGGVASAINVLCMAWAVAVNIWKHNVVEGWTTLSLQIAVMFFFLFIALIVLAEYVAQSFEEVKDCPLYHVVDERCSSTMSADTRKRNVCTTSITIPGHDDGESIGRRSA